MRPAQPASPEPQPASGADQSDEPNPIEPQSRDASVQPEDAAPDRLPPETVFGRASSDLSWVSHSAGADHDLRDRDDVGLESDRAEPSDEDERAGEYDGGEVAADRETVEAAPIDYELLWQQYDQQLLPMGTEIEKDRAIARQVIQDLGVEAAYQVIAESPHADSEESYVESVVASARQGLLSPEQQERGEQGLRVMNKLLSFEETQSYSGSNYLVKRDESNESLIVEAKDGRGEILRCEGRYVVSAAITEQDAQVLEQVDQHIDLEVQQQQQPQQQSKEQSRGFELN